MSSIRYTYLADYDENNSAPIGNYGVNISEEISTRSYYIVATGQNSFWLSDGRTKLYFSGVDDVNVGNYNSSLFVDFSDRTWGVNVSGGVFGDILYGGVEHDILNGDNGNDVLWGMAGNDTLNGGDGDDILEGGAGGDAINGGGGNNWLSFEHSTGSTLLSLSSGRGFVGDAQGDTYLNIQNVRGGLGSDSIYGDYRNNVIEGGGGFDYIDGSDGVDSAVYSRSLSAVSVDLTGSTRNSGGDALDDTLINIENISGSAFGDRLTGNGGDNTLTGGGGNDTLVGMGGADTLEGDEGDDRLLINWTPSAIDGGMGTDVLFVENNIFGNDIYLTDENFANIEKIYVRNEAALNMSGVNINGSGIGATIVSQSSANSYVDITGTHADDIIAGGKGTDIIHGDAGNDVITISRMPMLIDGGADKDNLSLQGGGKFFFTDISLVSIETIYVGRGVSLDLGGVTSGANIVSQTSSGSSSAITGSGGADTITAGKGADTIHGGNGEDRLTGGSSISATGLSTLFGDDGADVIKAAKSKLEAHGGAGNDTLIGGVGGGALSGDAGNDTIKAGATGLVIDGGIGSDKLFGGSGEDTFRFQAGFGRDSVYKFQIEKDHFDVSALVDSMQGINISELNGGANTLITFDGAGLGNKIILYGVDAESLKATHFGLLEPEVGSGLLLS
ncbi:calcium-binding protein [Methylobacterium sp. Leaf93]|uniref:calcium-binding protein n=1 Tax=Methylobacterium sp. Leaf93 TaxID=1736249 RepID=UPI0009EB8428|nr:calcium-binding protein [Methylobacterium sp. Leaf93]